MNNKLNLKIIQKIYIQKGLFWKKLILVKMIWNIIKLRQERTIGD